MDVVPSARLTTHGARRVLAAALEAAAGAGQRVSVAVTDAGGSPIVVERMDGAAAHTVHSAAAKAACAASTGKATGIAGAPIDMTYGLGIALAAGPHRWTPLPGGAPVLVDGECVGAVGVAGAPGEVDDALARAAAAILGHP